MDATKIHALGTGDRELFDSLIQEYYPRLMGYACILLDDEAARNVVQDVFLYVWEHRSRLTFSSGIQTYLFRACHSRMLNSLKRSKNFAGGGSLDALAQSEAEWLRANNDDIVRTLCNKELLERVLGIIEELPDKRREVFRLSFLHDMSNAEIAELLGMPRRTVEGHLYLALKFLRGRISAEELFALMLASIPMI